ncbi:PIN domain-containing protein [Streptomyces coeruleorubidus]|uniref:PIN domain-containing protein n=1 Tax=Streptomyces coeruleorubidus TaxID=116188 RepID=UPI0033E89F11
MRSTGSFNDDNKITGKALAYGPFEEVRKNEKAMELRRAYDQRQGRRTLLRAARRVPLQRPVQTRVRRDHGVTDLYPDASVPKNAARWISAVQHRMAQAEEHRSPSAVDLIIAATAAHHGLAVLHDDADYRAVARHASGLSEHNVHDIA